MNRRNFLKAAGASAVAASVVDLVPVTAAAEEPKIAGRVQQPLDLGWRFALGHASDPVKDFGFTQELGYVNAYLSAVTGPVMPGFDDSSWRTVDLPHDWVSELGYDPKANAAHGCRPVGRAYPENSIGWYRKKFDLPALPEGRRIHLHFEGIFRDAGVWVNGTYFTRNESGYSPFEIDITSVARFGVSNVVVVRADASAGEGWFYEGGGIYRHVWLIETAPVHVAPWGVFVTSDVQGNRAKVIARISVRNSGVTPQKCQVSAVVRDGEGKSIAETRSSSVSLDALGETEVRLEMTVDNPKRWDTSHPYLYTLEATIEQSGAAVDTYSTPFGIRTIRFDAKEGFFLNERKVVLKGTCNHQDHGGVGSAVPDRLFAWRLEQLREMGCNAVRCAHHQQAPAFLDACDRMGFLVLDEHRMMGAGPEVLRQLDTQIVCDRNHPSIFLYSLGNEENGIQNGVSGKRIAETMQAVIKRRDTTRPTTYAGNNGNTFTGINGGVDVRGWNYTPGAPMDAYHAAHPAQPNVGTEQAGNDWWPYFATHPFMSGGFVWSGFAYHGEANWPDVSSRYGVLDLCGYPREDFYRYQAWWRDDPVLQLRPDGGAVAVYTNCDSVELFLNRDSLGRKERKAFDTLQWTLPSSTGTLIAKGYIKGKPVIETTWEPAGDAAAIRLVADRTTLAADARDVAIINAEIVDSAGRIVPSARHPLTFSLEGTGKLLGVSNGDPACHEPENFPSRSGTASEPWQRSAFEGRAQIIVCTMQAPGDIRLIASTPGLTSATLILHTR